MALFIYGKNVIREAISANRKIYQIFIIEKTNNDILDAVFKKGIKVNEMSKFELNKRFQGNNQGIVAEVEDYRYKDLDDVLMNLSNNPLFIILDGLEDPHNLGAILRTCDAANVDGVIISKNRSVKLNSTVAKVSTGAIEYVNVIEVSNINYAIKKLKDNGFWIVGTDADTEKNYSEIEVDIPLGVVIGSEGKGISKLVKENCDYLVKIPMHGHVNSLNASVSTGILVFEILRKRNDMRS